MSTRANYFKLGLFIVTATAIGVVALIAFGLGSIFRRPLIVETYLNESVQGLEVGSKVKFRGVTIGSVSGIGFTATHYERETPVTDRKQYVLIRIELTNDELKDHGGALNQLIKSETDQGLRIRLASQGVTGLAYLELDYFDPAKYPVLPFDWEPDHTHIPSAPSTVTRFVAAVEKLFDRLDRIDVEQLAKTVNNTFATAQDKLEQLDVARINRNANLALEDARQTMAQIQRTLQGARIEALSTNANAVLTGIRRIVESGEISAAIQQLDQTLRRLDQLIAGNEAELGQSVANLRALSQSLRELAESAKRYPAQLLLGQPPKPVRFDKK